MIDRDWKNYDIYCDGCNDDLTIHADSWGEMMEEFKDNGWRAIKKDGDWEHYCPECQKNGRL
jgi:hypothetical protein